MKPFIGRKNELQKIVALKAKSSASLIVLMGRRRIGKSTLIDEAGHRFKNYLSIAGLAPHAGMDNLSQLKNFHSQLQQAVKKSIPPFYDWYSGLCALADVVSDGEWLVHLDEISWMGAYDVDFPGQLKVVWDKFFKQNRQLVLVICGSVSSWIEQNILKNSDFVGRISLQMILEELPLRDCGQFWGDTQKHISSLERLKTLSIIGGVPKYLEEIIPSLSAEENILRLCFTPEGPLVHEFDKIFNEVFLKRNTTYNKIIRKLNERRYSFSDLAKQLKFKPTGDFLECLTNLELSGFIKRDFVYDLKGGKSGVSRYRIKDNYLRFYCKYIEPNREKILSKNFSFESVYQFSNWEATVGLQFENLILQNLPELFEILKIRPATVLAASPYFQKKTARTKGACQIDLLISTSQKTLYICELKVRDQIPAQVVEEMKRKIAVLQIPRGYSVRPILIFEGGLTEKVKYELLEYFQQLVSFNEFF